MIDFLKQRKVSIGNYAIPLIWIAVFTIPLIFFVLYHITTAQIESELLEMVLLKLLAPSVLQTIILISCVLACTTVIAYSMAYYTALYRFPFHHLMGWGVLLTFGIPVYVLAYTYSDMFSITGVFAFMNIPFSGMLASVFVFTITLVPYVYIPLYAAFSQTLRTYVEQGEVMGLSRVQLWRKIILPLTLKPYILGATFVIFEVLSDYAVVQYFGVRTINVILQIVWLDYRNMALLAYIAAGVMVAILVLLSILEWRKRRTYTVSTTQTLMPQKRQMRGVRWIVIPFLFFMYMGVALIIPIGQLIVWSIRRSDAFRADLLFNSLFNSLFIALAVSSIIISIVVIFNHLFYLKYMRSIQNVYQYSSLFVYGFPSLILAIVILTTAYKLPPEFIMTLGAGTLGVAMLIIGYVVRFQSVAYNQIVAANLQYGKTLKEAAHVLGHTKKEVFFKVELGMLKGPIIMTTMLLSLDVLKELTMALFLRPLNFELLSTSIYRYVADESIALSAPYSLTLVAIMMSLIIGVKLYEQYIRK